MITAAEKRIEHLHWSTDGCSTLTGPLLRWMNGFDSRVAELATERGAEDYRFPSLIAALVSSEGIP